MDDNSIDRGESLTLFTQEIPPSHHSPGSICKNDDSDGEKIKRRRNRSDIGSPMLDTLVQEQTVERAAAASQDSSPGTNFFWTQPNNDAGEEKKSDNDTRSPNSVGFRGEDTSGPVLDDSSDSESSSSDESEPSVGEVFEPIPIEERRARNIAKNQKHLERLGLGARTKEPSQVDDNDEDEESCSDDPPLHVSGMLFLTPHNDVKTDSVAGKVSEMPRGPDVASWLNERYPARQVQIKMLSSLVGCAVGQMAANKNDREEAYAPAPIFVTGPSGTGKTSIVLDLLKATKLRYSALRGDADVSQIGIETAYVNCSTVDPCSIEAIVRSAFSQLTHVDDSSQSRRRKRKRRKRRRMRKHETTDEVRQVNKKRKSGSVGGDKSPGEQESIDEQHIEVGYGDEDEEAMEDRIETRRTQLSPVLRDEKVAGREKRTSLTRKAKTVVQDKVGVAGCPKVQNRRAKEQKAKKIKGTRVSHVAPAAFGKALAPFFGSESFVGSQRPGCAFLVLDHAERLLSLTTRKTVEKNNYLAQLLLLPKVYGLNLTVIVITTNMMLDCSRINNDVSVEQALGVISIGVRPLKIHFPAYSGKDTFKAILQRPNILSLIVGDSYTPSGESDREQNPKKSFINSFLDTLIQSLVGVTRDIREMIRLGRQVWPYYISPLHPENVNNTLKLVRSRLAQRSQNNGNETPSHEVLQKEVRSVLGEKLLSRIKSCTDQSLFRLTSGTSGERIKSSKAHGLPYLSKCLLLAAFICQTNKPDLDKRVFTIQKSGKKNKRDPHRSESNRDAEGAAYGSSTLEQQQLKMLRPRLFPMERMLSVFVNIVGLNHRDDLLQFREHNDMREFVRSMGSTSLFGNLAQLRENGLLHEVPGSAFKGVGAVNLNSTRYWCSVSRDEAEALASSVGLPLSNYLL